MTRVEALKLVAMLVAAYPAAQVSEHTAELYAGMLLDLEFAAAQQAIARLIATEKFLPTVAEIRAMTLDVQRGPRRSALEAWGDVCEQARRKGALERPAFQDPITAECVRLMGWQYICRSSSDAADRARFAELYDTLQDRARADAVAGRALPAPSGAETPLLEERRAERAAAQ